MQWYFSTDKGLLSSCLWKLPIDYLLNLSVEVIWSSSRFAVDKAWWGSQLVFETTTTTKKWRCGTPQKHKVREGSKSKAYWRKAVKQVFGDCSFLPTVEQLPTCLMVSRRAEGGRSWENIRKMLENVQEAGAGSSRPKVQLRLRMRTSLPRFWWPLSRTVVRPAFHPKFCEKGSPGGLCSSCSKFLWFTVPFALGQFDKKLLDSRTHSTEEWSGLESKVRHQDDNSLSSWKEISCQLFL